MFKPFALELYGRHMAGDTVQKLSLELGIPIERIEWRIKAAAAYIERQERRSASAMDTEDRAA
jgi:hypothetical protein